MKRTFLHIINIAAGLTFFVGACGIDKTPFVASIMMGISLAWLWVFAYANTI